MYLVQNTFKRKRKFLFEVVKKYSMEVSTITQPVPFWWLMSKKCCISQIPASSYLSTVHNLLWVLFIVYLFVLVVLGLELRASSLFCSSYFWEYSCCFAQVGLNHNHLLSSFLPLQVCEAYCHSELCSIKMGSLKHFPSVYLKLNYSWSYSPK
jgi:hypothetical protein